MTQYLLSVHTNEADVLPAEDDLAKLYADVDAFNNKIQAQGCWVFGGGLHPSSTATVVTAGSDGQVATTDGPYLESKEHLGGFWIVEAPDLDAALALAAEGSAACQGPVEVRPFQDDAG